LPDEAALELVAAVCLSLTATGYYISPKVIMIFLINLKIIYGEEDTVYEDGVDFIKKKKHI
jgi:hypothetical protein